MTMRGLKDVISFTSNMVIIVRTLIVAGIVVSQVSRCGCLAWGGLG